MGKDYEQAIYEEIQRGSKHIKGCLLSLVIEYQLKSQIPFHLPYW